MTVHDDERQPHEAKADALERELDEMDERREKLGEEIGQTEEQWERKKKDERVPGATAEEDEDEEDGGDDDAEELDFGRALAPDEDD